jgi:hypothetical protein
MKKAIVVLICGFFLSLSCQRQQVQKNPPTALKPDASTINAANPASISQVLIRGNRRIPTETIRAQIQTQPGLPPNQATVSPLNRTTNSVHNSAGLARQSLIFRNREDWKWANF